MSTASQVHDKSKDTRARLDSGWSLDLDWNIERGKFLSYYYYYGN